MTDQNTHKPLSGGEVAHLSEEGTQKGAQETTEVRNENCPIPSKVRNENQLQNDDIYIDVQTVVAITGKAKRTIQWQCDEGKVKAIITIGNGGKQYRIALSSLPDNAQVKWVIENQSAAAELPSYIKDKLAPQAQWEITKLTAPREEVGMDILTNEAAKERLSEKIDLVQKALTVPAGWKKSAWVSKTAEDAGITRQTLYNDIKKYKEGGLKALVKVREKKGPTAWDTEALDYMEGVYLKAIREGGDASKRFAYKATVAEANKRDWKIGSESSAYEHLGKLNPLLEKYARGGSRALDNVFYIMRQYHDLEAFECIVGDQHRFDFWVHDRELNRVFRMESYMWLDLRTRLVYGVSIADRYNSYMIGLSMRMGMKHWGKFKTAYTDNGKPETSKYTNSILNDLRAYGMQELDIAELYRTNDGYAVEGNEGEIIEVVSTSQAWHRHARPYNAKAKLIERFFRTIEQILVDLGVPGLVKELKGNSEEKALSDKRLKRLVEEGKLLTPEEFTLKLFEAVELYQNRRHSALKRSPMDELWHTVKQEGFTPRMVIESELDFVLLARDMRSVNRGRVWIDKRLYEGVSLEQGLWDIADSTKVEVRYDHMDEDIAIAIRPDGAAVPLRLVTQSSMKNKEATSELMEWKRSMIKKVKEHYRRLTAPIPGVVEYSTHTKAAMSLKKAQKAIAPKLTESEYKASVDRIVAESTQTQTRKPLMLKKPVFGTEYDHYKWAVESQLNGYALPENESTFMKDYEGRMDEAEKVHWEEFRKFYHISNKAVNEGR